MSWGWLFFCFSSFSFSFPFLSLIIFIFFFFFFFLCSYSYIDLSSNDLYTIKGLEQCTYLTEINLNTNDLKDFSEISPLLRLPYLARLDISNNKFSKKALKNFKRVASEKNPKLEIICNSGEAGEEAGVKHEQPAPSSGGSCCSMQ